ncbi:MAG: 3-deoxy-8-phosphooctulonate synthase [Acidobacteria bacterium]|nr:MAG: 3-deoxy-8-phosphooctulonate synthase [Acidobacteriota bacterium]
MTASSVELAPGVVLGSEREFPVIAGPCVIESEEITLEVARTLKEIAGRMEFPLIFKASFDKANRSSIKSFRGPGLTDGLAVLRTVAAETDLPILTDVHEPAQCEKAAEVAAVLQVPAFLCRQTDLILAAADTGRAVNLKKGQFMAPDDMRRAVDKVKSRGNERVSVTERGFSFGYHNLVVDMRSFSLLAQDGIPVIYDVTHSLQLPGAGEQTGGQRQFALPLVRAAVAAGADGLYLEVHPEPAKALSDSTTQLDPTAAEALLTSALTVRRAVTTPESAT